MVINIHMIYNHLYKGVDTMQLLDNISEQYNKLLGKNLIGIYVHGSIAFCCFNWDRSDIDFIVVVKEPLSQQTKFEIIQAMLELNKHAPQKGFEMSVVLEKYCKSFVYPTPYELHFSNDCLDDYKNEKPKADYDLAAHFTVIKNVGITLYGTAIEEVFGHIPHEDYFDSIRKDIENAKIDVLENPVYVVLNLCRVYAYIKDGLILSKEQGGLWGLANLPEEYHITLKEMLDYYVDGISFNKSGLQLVSFCEYMLDLIFNL